MILGTSLEIVNIQHIQKILAQKGSLSEFFTSEEIHYCETYQSPFEHYAGRYAAKLAFKTALTPLLKNTIGFQEISVLRYSNGQPFFKLPDLLLDSLKKLGTIQVLLSLSHAQDYAVAFVIIEKIEE